MPCTRPSAAFPGAWKASAGRGWRRGVSRRRTVLGGYPRAWTHRQWVHDHAPGASPHMRDLVLPQAATLASPPAPACRRTGREAAGACAGCSTLQATTCATRQLHLDLGRGQRRPQLSARPKRWPRHALCDVSQDCAWAAQLHATTHATALQRAGACKRLRRSHAVHCGTTGCPGGKGRFVGILPGRALVRWRSGCRRHRRCRAACKEPARRPWHRVISTAGSTSAPGFPGRRPRAATLAG